MTGLALMLTRIGWLASLIQIAGGCYLVYLGVMAWLATKPATTAQGFGVAPAGTLRGLRMGLIVNLSNPKGVAFFIGLCCRRSTRYGAMGEARDPRRGFALEILWYGFVIVLLSSRPARVAYERFGFWIERTIGTVLAAFGLRLISEKL